MKKTVILILAILSVSCMTETFKLSNDITSDLSQIYPEAEISTTIGIGSDEYIQVNFYSFNMGSKSSDQLSEIANSVRDRILSTHKEAKYKRLEVRFTESEDEENAQSITTFNFENSSEIKIL